MTDGVWVPTPLRFVLSVLMINTGWFASFTQTLLPVNATMWFIDVHNNWIEDCMIINALAGEPFGLYAFPPFLFLLTTTIPVAIIYREIETWQQKHGSPRKVWFL